MCDIAHRSHIAPGFRAHVEAFALLGTAGCDIYKGESRVFRATQIGDRTLLNALVKAGYDVNRATRYGWTPACIASLNGHARAIKALVAAGCDVDQVKISCEISHG